MPCDPEKQHAGVVLHAAFSYDSAIAFFAFWSNCSMQINRFPGFDTLDKRKALTQ